ncbi:MAG: M56 family metallopeptidase [Bacteroidota bacterium]
MQTYLVEMTLTWASCWALYVLFFRKEKFFRLNRWYLLSSYAAGLVVPLIEWSPVAAAAGAAWVAEPVIWLQTIPVTAIHSGPLAHPGWFSTDLLYLIYTIGCSLMLGRLMYQVLQLSRWVRTGETRWQNGICYVQHPDCQAPASCWWFLFWNDAALLTSEESAAILAHEEAHLRQGHSWDLLLLEVSGIFLWWHPLWYAYRHSLVTTHEFLADQAALHVLPKRAYGHLLIQQQLRGTAPAFAHTFNHHQLKNRITMMTRPPSKWTALGKYLLLLPAMLLLFYACNEAERQIDEAAQTIENQPNFYERVDTVITFDPDSYTESTQVVKTKIYQEVELMPVFGSCDDLLGEERMQCSNQNMLMHIYTNINYPAAAREAGHEGMAVIELVVNRDGSVSDVQLLEDKTTEHQSLNEEALRVIRELPDFQPGSQDGEPVNVRLVIPIKFQLE